LHVLDLAELRLIREIREPGGERVYARAVHGLRAPRMAIIRDDDQTRLLDTRGQPSFESARKHLYHALGLSLLMQDKPEEALAPLEQAERCEEGLCDMGELIALCAPLSDTGRTRSGSPRWRRRRARR
jgi:hypothetical protein